MIQVTFQRNLVALEDLLLGVGTVVQTRGFTDVTVTKINGANFPYDNTFTMQQKFDDLQAQIDNLPVVVDQFGNLLTGLIDTSAVDISGTHAGRLWRKTINANLAQIYYGSELILEYDPTNGNLITDATAYVAADVVVTNAFIAADAIVTANYIAADTALFNALTANYIAAIATESLAYIAADVVVTDAFIAADSVLNDKINHRVSVIQQTNIIASSNITYTISYNSGSWAKVTAASPFTFAFAFPAGEVCSMILEIVNGGNFAIAWPAAMRFPGGTIPALTTSGTDHLVIYQDGNNNLYASVTASDVKTV
jgi:hypothetical protein